MQQCPRRANRLISLRVLWKTDPEIPCSAVLNCLALIGQTEQNHKVLVVVRAWAVGGLDGWRGGDGGDLNAITLTT